MRFAMITFLALVTIAPACSSDDSTGPGGTPGGVAGTWKATKAEFVSRSNPAVRTDVVAQGANVVLALGAGGAYTLTMTDPGKGPRVTGGTWSASSDVLTLKQTGMSGEIQFDMTQSANSLTLDGGHVLFDFQANGVLQEATLSMTLVRQ